MDTYADTNYICTNIFNNSMADYVMRNLIYSICFLSIARNKIAFSSVIGSLVNIKSIDFVTFCIEYV